MAAPALARPEQSQDRGLGDGAGVREHHHLAPASAAMDSRYTTGTSNIGTGY